MAAVESSLLREKSSYKYIYVDENNNVHIMVPISAGQKIATDNTCKSTYALKQFFATSNGNTEEGSVFQALQSYMADLMADIGYLRRYGVNNTIVKAKEERYGQLRRYLYLLQTVPVRESVKDLQSAVFPEYPAPIQKALANTQPNSNFFTMQLSPRVEDNYYGYIIHNFPWRVQGISAF